MMLSYQPINLTFQWCGVYRWSDASKRDDNTQRGGVLASTDQVT